MQPTKQRQLFERFEVRILAGLTAALFCSLDNASANVASMIWMQVQKFLGKGSYGSVYRVKRNDDQNVYAVKETDVTKLSQEERRVRVQPI
jgi:serine/threonine protein kinase